FRAEDGIRARNVTGVQTCALPIWYEYLPPEPSEPGSNDNIPLLSLTLPSIAAPAPSPNETHVLRSVQSVTLDNFSTPITKPWLYTPLPIHCSPLIPQYINPAHAALISIAAAFLAPSRS